MLKDKRRGRNGAADGDVHTDYNLPSVVDQILNRYIKDILKDLSENVPTLAVKVPTKLTMKLTMKQKEKEKAGELTVERNDKGEVMMSRYDCVTTHTARRSGITNMYLSHKFTIVQMMHVSGHKTQKTFMDYIKLSSDELNNHRTHLICNQCEINRRRDRRHRQRRKRRSILSNNKHRHMAENQNKSINFVYGNNRPAT